MKKIIVSVMIFALFLTGCSFNAPQNSNEDMKKQSKIEIYSVQDDTLLKTIDNQDMINILLETDNWQETEEISDDVVPEYKLLIYQEKTLLLGQDPSVKRDYELIETIITFQNSPYIEEVISSDVIKSTVIPENVMTFYYIMPDATVEKLHELLCN